MLMHVNGRDLNFKYLFVSHVLMGRLLANIKFFQREKVGTVRGTWPLVGNPQLRHKCIDR